jgi:hypothetical protein
MAETSSELSKDMNLQIKVTKWVIEQDVATVEYLVVKPKAKEKVLKETGLEDCLLYNDKTDRKFLSSTYTGHKLK